MMAIETIIVRSDAVLSANAGDEIVLMNVENGQYYGLTDTSRAIWELIASPIRVGDLCAMLAETYDVPIVEVENTTLAFLNYLEAQKLASSCSDLRP